MRISLIRPRIGMWDTRVRRVASPYVDNTSNHPALQAHEHCKQLMGQSLNKSFWQPANTVYYKQNMMLVLAWVMKMW